MPKSDSQKKRGAKFHEPFPKRLRELMDPGGFLGRERKISQQQLATFLGIQRQTVSEYMSGSSSPDVYKLVKIAKYFRVSTDYLTGLSDAQSTDDSVKAFCALTKLSETSARALIREPAYGEVLNSLLSCKGIDKNGETCDADVLQGIRRYLQVPIGSNKVISIKNNGDAIISSAEEEYDEELPDNSFWLCDIALQEIMQEIHSDLDNTRRGLHAASDDD